MSTFCHSLREGRIPFHPTVFLEDGSSHFLDRSKILSLTSSGIVALEKEGIRRSDRVAIILPDGFELALAFLCVSSHCIAAPLNPKASLSDLTAWLEDLQPSAVLVSEKSTDNAREAAHRLGIPVLEQDAFPRIEDDSRDLSLPGPDDVALILHTSGTTAKPKMVPLTHGNLLRSALNIADTLRLGPDDVCLNLMPMFHIHGIVACLLAPLVSGGRVVVPGPIEPEDFFRLLKERGATWYSAVPTRHAHLLEYMQANTGCAHGHGLRFVRSSSAALPMRMLEVLETAFGVPVIEAYGMTEAAHQMCSNPLPPAVRKPGSVGLPAGPQVRVVDSEGNELPRGETGEVVIKGDNVTPGYLNLPEERQERFEGGWFRTGDLGHMDEDGYLFLLGRAKEIVNRGGEKVSPAEVDACLLAHEAVAEAVCFGVPHPSLGEDLAAAVVLQPGAVADEPSLRNDLFDRLSDFKIPSRILIVDSIPKSSIGKVQRKRMADWLKPLLESGSDGPANDTERFLVELFRDIIPGSPEVGRKGNFFGLGGDSLHAIRAAHRIVEKYGIELPPHEVFRYPTPENLGVRIEVLRKEKLLRSLEARLSSLSEEQVRELLKKEK
jgi:acyl-CoA synthetase (AMP-forming)/AMP-acid ligase II